MRACVALVLLVVAVTAEHCRDTMDCAADNCVQGTMPQCMNHVCTCEDMMATTKAPHNMCVSQADCAHMHHGGHCMLENVHCVDGHCHCTKN